MPGGRKEGWREKREIERREKERVRIVIEIFKIIK